MYYVIDQARFEDKYSPANIFSNNSINSFEIKFSRLEKKHFYTVHPFSLSNKSLQRYINTAVMRRIELLLIRLLLTKIARCSIALLTRRQYAIERVCGVFPY